MRRRKAARVLGPYPHGRQWRIIVVDQRGTRTASLYPERRLADEVIRSLTRKLGGSASLTIEEALTQYTVYLRDVKQNRGTSIATTMHRLDAFFVDREASVRGLDESVCQSLYARLASQTKTDTHRNTLAEAKTFLKWCMRNGHVRTNPLEAVEGVGRRKKGKPQLRIDEARKWMEIALWRAQKQPGAVAALVSLLMGLRATEIISREVRDLDDRGTLLWIPSSKTEAGKRSVEVPEVLHSVLHRLANGRSPSDRLFGHHWRDWVRKWVRRICIEAGVPTVSAHAMRGLHSSLAVRGE